MKKWKVGVAARYKDGTVDDKIEGMVLAESFCVACLKAELFAKHYPSLEDKEEQIEEVRVWNIGIVSDDIF